MASLFGGSGKRFNAQLLQNILNQGANRQRGEIQAGFNAAQAPLRQFEQTSQQLGEAFETGANQRAQQFAQGLQNIESPEIVRQQQAQAQELAFRNLPAAQQAIRENLAATGGLNRGAAIRALQQPVLQASQQAADLGFQAQQAGQLRNVQRQQQALDAIFRTGQGAALQRLGIDRGTAEVLLNSGRSDILNRAFKLAGIEAGRTQGLLDIEQQRQAAEIARDQAKRARTGALIGSIGSIAGAGLGALTGNPFGASIGSSIGGGLGGLAGGGAQPVDLSGILALRALQQNRTGPKDFSLDTTTIGRRQFTPAEMAILRQGGAL